MYRDRYDYDVKERIVYKTDATEIPDDELDRKIAEYDEDEE